MPQKDTLYIGLNLGRILHSCHERFTTSSNFFLFLSLSSVYRFYFHFSPCRILSVASGHTSECVRIKTAKRPRNRTHIRKRSQSSHASRAHQNMAAYGKQYSITDKNLHKNITNRCSTRNKDQTTWIPYYVVTYYFFPYYLATLLS